MSPEEELDLWTIDLQWIRARILDSRNEVAEAYGLIKDNHTAREHLANCVGTLDTIADRLVRLAPEDGSTGAALTDIKSGKKKNLLRKIIGV